MLRRRGLKVKRDSSKVLVLGSEDGLNFEVLVIGTWLQHETEFEYLGCALDESATDDAECRMKVVSGRRVAGDIKSMIKAKGLQFEFEKVVHEALLTSVLYGSEKLIWR